MLRHVIFACLSTSSRRVACSCSPRSVAIKLRPPMAMRGFTLFLLLAGSATAVQHKESTSLMSSALSHVQEASDRLVQAEEKLPTSARYVLSTLKQGTLRLIPGLNFAPDGEQPTPCQQGGPSGLRRRMRPLRTVHEGDWRDEWRNPEAGETTAADSDTKQELVGDWRTEYGPQHEGFEARVPTTSTSEPHRDTLRISPLGVIMPRRYSHTSQAASQRSHTCTASPSMAHLEGCQHSSAHSFLPATFLKSHHRPQGWSGYWSHGKLVTACGNGHQRTVCQCWTAAGLKTHHGLDPKFFWANQPTLLAVGKFVEVSLSAKRWSAVLFFCQSALGHLDDNDIWGVCLVHKMCSYACDGGCFLSGQTHPSMPGTVSRDNGRSRTTMLNFGGCPW